jgi:hypothetical protein
MEGHWTEETTHEKLSTPDAKARLAKFATQEDGHVAYLELEKVSSRPYKLPKSLESLPDDTARAEFTSGAEAVLGVKRVKSEEDLKDVDFAKGMKNAKDANPDIEAAIKKFAIEKGHTKAQVEDLVAFSNQTNQGLKNAKEQEIANKAEEVKKALVVMCGSEDKVSSSYDGVRRLFQNHCGFSEQEYESVGKTFIEKVLTQDAVMSKGLFNLAESIVTEGDTETGSKGGEKKPASMVERQNKELPGITSRLWPKK